MHNSAIFSASTVLLVPFLYYAASLPDACALPPDPNFDGPGCKTDEAYKEGLRKTCCWFEPGTGTGLIKLREKYCQTCTTTGGQTTCDQKELQYIGTPQAQDGGLLQQDPSTDSGPKPLHKDGMIFKFENNTASPEMNSTR